MPSDFLSSLPSALRFDAGLGGIEGEISGLGSWR